jgi:hypothetical protein
MLILDRQPDSQADAPPSGDLYDPGMLRERLVGAEELRKNFSDHMGRVQEGAEVVVVLRRSKVVGAFVPEWVLSRAKEAGILDEQPPGVVAKPE